MINSKKLFFAPYLWLALCAVASFFVLAFPLYVIQPFRQQGPRELAFALAILETRTFIQIVFALLAITLSVWSWKRSVRLRGRVAAVLLAIAIIGCIFLSRINVYERMFNPLTKPIFTAATDTRLDGGEQVLAIKVDGTARAYPIRVISYHHIVNDVVGGFPIVATY